jgi:hypothetical protein
MHNYAFPQPEEQENQPETCMQCNAVPFIGKRKLPGAAEPPGKTAPGTLSFFGNSIHKKVGKVLIFSVNNFFAGRTPLK